MVVRGRPRGSEEWARGPCRSTWGTCGSRGRTSEGLPAPRLAPCSSLRLPAAQCAERPAARPLCTRLPVPALGLGPQPAPSPGPATPLLRVWSGSHGRPTDSLHPAARSGPSVVPVLRSPARLPGLRLRSHTARPAAFLPALSPGSGAPSSALIPGHPLPLPRLCRAPGTCAVGSGSSLSAVRSGKVGFLLGLQAPVHQSPATLSPGHGPPSASRLSASSC